MPGGVVAPLWLVKEWQTDAFHHGIRAGPTLTVISTVFTALALIVVLTRLYDRVLVRRNAGLDDALIMAALIPTVGLAISTCLAEQYYGFDRHVWDLTVDLAAPSRKITLSISICYLVATGLTKISILFFYRRIGEIRKWFRWTLWVCMAFIVLYTIAFTLAIPFECHPLDAYWNKANPLWTMTHDWHCINEGAKMVSAGAISAFQDVVACILPMALFWDLRISRQAKIALAVVFSLGLFTCIVSIIRTVKIYWLFYQTYDVTWAARWAFSLTILEVDLGLICASMPALKNNLQRMLHVVIDPFTVNSLKTNGRWRNPFFASYQKSFPDYFGRGTTTETSQAQSQGTYGLAAPSNTLVGTTFTTFSLMTAFSDGLTYQGSAHSPKTTEFKSVTELELSPPRQRQEV